MNAGMQFPDIGFEVLRVLLRRDPVHSRGNRFGQIASRRKILTVCQYFERDPVINQAKYGYSGFRT
jgi:hypothetical protein